MGDELPFGWKAKRDPKTRATVYVNFSDPRNKVLHEVEWETRAEQPVTVNIYDRQVGIIDGKGNIIRNEIPAKLAISFTCDSAKNAKSICKNFDELYGPTHGPGTPGYPFCGETEEKAQGWEGASLQEKY